MKIALIEVSHWHAPIYVEKLLKMQANVVAVTDKNHEIAKTIAKNFNCTWYNDYKLMIKKERPDFVFVFGKHFEMPLIAKYLIKNHVQFAMEKPMGISSQDIEKLKKLQDSHKCFIAIPFIFRYSPILKKIEKLINNNVFGLIAQLYFRFIAGPPSRYLESNNEWMLDPKRAGGGCTINLAVHFIDLFLYLIKDQFVRTVSAALNNLTYNTDIEDFSTIVLKTNRNVICTIETGYTFPMTSSHIRDISYYITTTHGYLSIKEKKFTWLQRDGKIVHENIITATEDYYPIFIEKTLSAFIQGKKPLASLNEMFQVMKIIDAVYLSNSMNTTISLS